MDNNKPDIRYEVLSPWADAEPIPIKGLANRISSLNGRRIGLIRNGKVTAEPILKVIEARLKKISND
jgi:hypothetical protein